MMRKDSTKSTWDIVISVCGTSLKFFSMDFKNFRLCFSLSDCLKIEQTIQLNKNLVVVACCVR